MGPVRNGNTRPCASCLLVSPGRRVRIGTPEHGQSLVFMFPGAAAGPQGPEFPDSRLES